MIVNKLLCANFVLIATLFDRIDCSECAAPFCEECDHLEKEEGK